MTSLAVIGPAGSCRRGASAPPRYVTLTRVPDQARLRRDSVPAKVHPRRHPPGPITVVTTLCSILLLVLPALATQVSDEQVREIAFQLRCVVCQNLSVADSPSETASQMRQIIRERLALGESREQILDYFVSKYGEWILLSPPRRGFNLVVWGLPFAGLLAGLVTIAVVVRRWSRSRREEPAEVADPAYRERVRRELKELDR